MGNSFAKGEKEGQTAILENDYFQLEVCPAGADVQVRLYDKKAAKYRSDGPYVYYAVVNTNGGGQEFSHLDQIQIQSRGNSIRIIGQLAGLNFEQIYTMPKNKPYIEENMVLANHTGATVSLQAFEARMQLLVTDADGQVLPSLAQDHLMAIPFLHRSTDPQGYRNDFTIEHILTQEGRVFRVGGWPPRQIPGRHYLSDAWAWRHGDGSFGIFSFNQDNLIFSFLTPVSQENGSSLRFGGVCRDSMVLSALDRFENGQTLELGLTRYQYVPGDYQDCAYAYRAMLDEKNCRFPAGFNPPVHWNQLYNMNGAWNDRKDNYTLDRVLQEAAKARDFSCEALYLDPGWDTTFGSFLWGREWLGDPADFVKRIRKEYNLVVSLHTPMPPWASDPGLLMGPLNVDEWPASCRRMVWDSENVPKYKEGRRNLARLDGVRATASGTIPGHNIHKVEHLIDGRYGNSNSWVADQQSSWVQLDLGAMYEINSVCLSNDQQKQFRDRQATDYTILVSDKIDQTEDYVQVAHISQRPLQTVNEVKFSPRPVCYIRIVLDQTAAGDAPRLDEVQVYEANPTGSVMDAEKPKMVPADDGAYICMGSRSFLDEAEKRLLALCQDGVTFLMFDGTWFNPCVDASHGHPIPFTYEDHIDACVDLARRIHRRFPNVLIEMHDMMAGGSYVRATPVYYKYGLEGSYDDNWAFELMWEPMKNIQTGLSTAAYYYDLACNVPLYLHINLGDDNEHCLSLWWYASTCRHLGIGGDHANPKVTAAHLAAMKKYRQLESFFKRGDFYGINEEIHLHVLPEQQAVVVNVFNLSDQPRTINGRMELEKMGLDPARTYQPDQLGCRVEEGMVKVNQELPAWGTEVVVLRAE